MGVLGAVPSASHKLVQEGSAHKFTTKQPLLKIHSPHVQEALVKSVSPKIAQRLQSRKSRLPWPSSDHMKDFMTKWKTKWIKQGRKRREEGRLLCEGCKTHPLITWPSPNLNTMGSPRM